METAEQQLKKKRPAKPYKVLDSDISKIKDGDTHSRVNYLYQLAHTIYPLNPILARRYIQEMREVARKHVVRIDPTIKHTFCKNCGDLFFMSPAAVFHYQGKELIHILLTR